MLGLLVAVTAVGLPPSAALAVGASPSAPRLDASVVHHSVVHYSVVHYRAPLPAPVVVTRAFSGDVGRYAAGHRGVDLRAGPAAPVFSAGNGTVTFAGMVAGRPLVTIKHADLIVTEYEPVQATVVRGAVVSAGTRIGILSGTHPGCEEAPCLHWGARRGDHYVDPMMLLQPLGVVRLVPDSTELGS